MRFLSILLLIQSAFASSPYLIEELRIEQASGLEKVLLDLDTVSSKQKHLVSLGESHLHPVTARAVQEVFVDRYLSHNFEFKFCAEKIMDFLEHPAGMKLQEKSALSEVYEDNSPNTTDFKKCKEKGFDKYFAYSGFFHQLPFARPFPLEFTPSRVITEDGENIRDQLKIKDSFFLIQIELEYLELVTQGHFLREVPQSIELFKSRVLELKRKFVKLKDSQETILESHLKAKTKVGVFFDKQSLQHLGDKSYFLVTDLAYRKDLTPLTLLSNLIKLDDSALGKLIKKLSRDPVYITAGIQEPDEQGRLYETGYGTIPWLFPANSTFMELRIAPGENVVITADPKAIELTCIAYKKLNVSFVDCNDYLSNIP
tara:strand:- start:141 stop:1253 length:1113 start_codon:yes stop_codon:yes gene_type:complete